MTFITPTDPKAAKVEAADLRSQASGLLNKANELDPQPVEKPKKDGPDKVSRSAKDGKFVSEAQAKKSPNTTVTEKRKK